MVRRDDEIPPRRREIDQRERELNRPGYEPFDTIPPVGTSDGRLHNLFSLPHVDDDARKDESGFVADDSADRRLGVRALRHRRNHDCQKRRG